LIALVFGSAGCGKKGPPLAPFVNVPSEATVAAPRRVGDDIYVTVTVPAQNIDGSKPASVSRVEVYGATLLTPPARARFLQIAERVATIPVAPVPGPGVPPAAGQQGAAQAAAVTIRDEISPQELEPLELPPLPGAEAQNAKAVAAPPVKSLRRFYMAIAFSERGISGPLSTLAELPLAPLPEPPVAIRAANDATTATVTWEPAGGLLSWLLDHQTQPAERPPLDNLPRPVRTPSPSVPELPGGPTTYSVYRELAPDPLTIPAAAAVTWHTPPPPAVTNAPIAALSYSERIDLDERMRCYTVRSVRGGVEGVASPPACITPIDVYPPAAPTGINVVAADGRITVIWDSNTETDLGGYIVLRREAGSATLLPITPAPIGETRFVDRDVKPGVEYVYAVVAVDSRLPVPNMSPLSVERSDTAR
jgi:hypothetical protein